MVRAAIFFSMITTLVIASYADEGSKEQPTSKSDPNIRDFEFELEVLDNGVPVVTYPIEINHIDADAKIRCILAITNSTAKALTLNTVEVGCACTDAVVPHETLKPNEVVHAMFTFPGIKLADRGGTAAYINTEGVVSRLNLVFTGGLTNLAKFRDNIVNLEFDSENFENNNALAEFFIPMVVSPDVSIDQLTFEYDKSLPITKHKFVKVDGFNQVYLSIDTTEVDPDGLAGEIRLAKKNGASVAIPCYVRRSSRVSVSPSSLGFQDSRSATAFMRIKPTKDKKTDEVYSIKDLTDRFSVEYKRIANGVYRLTIKAKPETKEVDTSSSIHLEINTSTGAYQSHIGISSW